MYPNSDGPPAYNPNGSPYNPNGPTYNPNAPMYPNAIGPAGAVAVATPLASAPPLLQDQQAQGPRNGAWQDGICDWTNQCIPTTCAAVFCSPCLTARFYDQYVKRKSYWIVFGVLASLILLQYIFLQLADSLANKHMPKPSAPADDQTTTTQGQGQGQQAPPTYTPTVDVNAPWFQAYAAYSLGVRVVGALLLIIGCILLCGARGAMRKRHNIPGNECEDLCCSFFCRCCVLAQMYRHVRGTNGRQQQCCEEVDCAGLGPVGV